MSVNLKSPVLSYSLISLQFGMFALILISGHAIYAQTSTLQIIQALSVFIGLWAVYSMKIFGFNIIPDPKPNAQLVTSGPYKYIRHPMYTSVLLYFGSLVLDDVSLSRLVFLTILIVTLIVKLNYEETMLSSKFDDYSNYQQQSKKLFPYFY